MVGEAPPSVHRPPDRGRRRDDPLMDPRLNIVPTPVLNRIANSPTVGVKSKNKGRSRPYYFRICKRNMSSKMIETLPDEVLFNILLQLRVEDISKAAMVCWKWYHMIRTHDFAHAHRVQHSISGLVIHPRALNRWIGDPPVFVAMRKGRIEVSEFVYPIRRGVWCSCNGLILERDLSLKRALRITNPSTKQHFVVPPFPRRISKHSRSCLTYSAASMEYKVVHTYCGSEEDVFHCAILTVGVDKSWGSICTKHLCPISKRHLFGDPIITEGFIHWADGDSNPHVLTLNVETETIVQYPTPQSQDYENLYFSAGKSLSLFIVFSDLYLEGWDMKSETGEWTKLYNINFSPRKCEFERFHSEEHRHVPFLLLPVGWIKYQEVLAFHFSHPSTVCTAYNVLTQELDFFELDSDARYHEYVPHTINNLEWLTWG